jgi:hypothetical protein
MPKTKKPLFSRPFLSALMIIIPAMVLLLNLTANEKHYVMPEIKTWTTASGVPVIWLVHDEWTARDTIEIRILFNHGYSNDSKLSLTEFTFDFLLKDTLPLSTTYINDRLKPLAASVSYKVQSNKSELAFSIDGLPSLLNPSIELLSAWLPEPSFKLRTFANRENALKSSSPQKQQLLNATFGADVNNTSKTQFYDPIQMDDIHQTYQILQQHIDKIVVVGALPDVNTIKQNLNSITHGFSASLITSPVAQVQTKSLQTNEGRNLLESYGGLPLPTLNQPKEWFTLQFWATYFLQEVNKENNANHVELRIEVAQPLPWIWWRIQHAPPILQSPQTNPPLDDGTFYSKLLLDNMIPNADEFETTVELFQERMLQQSKQTIWWANIATQVTQGNTRQLESWINNYTHDLNNFSYKIYQQELVNLIKLNQLHEVQIRQ